MQTAINIEKLSVSVDKIPILADITAQLPEGKIIGLLGPSGAGKTTIIRSILGLQKPSSGSVTVFGLKPGIPALRRQTGYLSQDAASYTDLTIYENVRYFGSLIGLDKAAVSKTLEQVELADRKDQIVSSLSGGQQARVSLAIALLGNPKLLLLDEPTVGLDPILRHTLWKLFRSLTDSGTTIVVTSHVMDEAERCDELLFIRRGSLLASGTPSAILHQTHSKNMEDAFLKLAQSTQSAQEATV
jgi:ABC-2 type transport system ATP-binding protein